MKRLFLLIALVLFVGNLSAQTRTEKRSDGTVVTTSTFYGVTTITEKFPNGMMKMTQITPCVMCSGTGRCMACGGRGAIYSYFGMQACAGCGGTGRCRMCGGSGETVMTSVADLSRPSSSSGNYGGGYSGGNYDSGSSSSSSSRRTCPSCNGTGKGMSRIEYSPNYTGQDNSRYCSECGRTMSAHVHIHEKCKTCYGRGYVN